MKHQQLFNWLGSAAFALILSFLFGSGVKNSIIGVQAQSEKKTVKLAPAINSQLKISELRVGQQTQKLDESFNAETDWVKNLSFKLENISGKPIVYLSVNVNFPETKSTGNLMSYPISFGQHPNHKLKDSKPMLLKSGETIEVLLESEKDKMDKFINTRQPIESIRKVELEIGFIIFEDGTAWSAGSFMRQDPNDPRRYNPIKSEPPR